MNTEEKQRAAIEAERVILAELRNGEHSSDPDAPERLAYRHLKRHMFNGADPVSWAVQMLALRWRTEAGLPPQPTRPRRRRR